MEKAKVYCLFFRTVIVGTALENGHYCFLFLHALLNLAAQTYANRKGIALTRLERNKNALVTRASIRLTHRIAVKKKETRPAVWAICLLLRQNALRRVSKKSSIIGGRRPSSSATDLSLLFFDSITCSLKESNRLVIIFSSIQSHSIDLAAKLCGCSSMIY